MMTRTQHWIVHTVVALTLLCGVSGCDGDGPEEIPAGPNLLIETQGEVHLKRDGWKDYVPVSFGVEVQRGDLIRPGDEQPVTILCADLSLHTIEREKGCPCKVEEPVLTYGDTRLLSPRGPDKSIPYILHPRNTKVLDAHPLLRWHDTGAVSYTVAIIRGSETIWQQKGVQGIEMHYSDDAPALRPEVDYLLYVADESSGHHSGEDPAKGLGFQVLSADAQAAVQARRDEILSLPLGNPSCRFALAVYCAGEGLRGEALALLDEIAPSVSAPAVQLRRGNLLLTMQLPDEAESAYQAALADAESTGDLEAQAAAHAGLWWATRDQSHSDTALELYHELGLEEEQAAEMLNRGQ
jgi:hypothetical protein